MERVTLEEALHIIHRVGSYARDEGLLESALARPAASVFGQATYLSLPLAAAAQSESLARNDALMDGDKPTTFVPLNVFLSLNNARLEADNDAVFYYILDVAQGNLSVEESANFIQARLKSWP